MSSIPHDPAPATRNRVSWAERLDLPAMWASLAIAAMWLAVAVDAIWGPNFVSTSGSGTNTTSIPSTIFVALFAWLATSVLAKRAFGERR